MIRAIVFDLGGVLIDWDGVTPLVRLTGGRLTAEQARRFWFASPWVRRFESGHCAAADFLAGIMGELGLEMPVAVFREEFLSWNHGFYPGGRELLARLRRRYTLGCLTNNNPLYIGALVDEHDLEMQFDHLFISFRTGLLKPDRAAFEQVVAQLATRPEEILFFDDNIECVEAAQAVGLLAEQVRGVVGVQAVVDRLGLLAGDAAG